jgi:antibiotic biosynthesis monooxygenase
MKLSGIALAAAAACCFALTPAEAKTIVNPDGSQPLVHWAVLHSTDGQMPAMQRMAAENVAPYAAAEDGTYILYGGVDKNNPNIQRLLEIYRDEDAYQVHRGSEGFRNYQIARATILEQLIIMEADPFMLESKESGTGMVVRMNRTVVKPEALEQYKAALRQLIEQSMAAENGTLALMATTEKEHGNIFHTLEIYTDDAAYEAHTSSAFFKTFKEATESMIVEETQIENLPTTITLSAKP